MEASGAQRRGSPRTKEAGDDGAVEEREVGDRDDKVCLHVVVAPRAHLHPRDVPGIAQQVLHLLKHALDDLDLQLVAREDLLQLRCVLRLLPGGLTRLRDTSGGGRLVVLQGLMGTNHNTSHHTVPEF